KRSHGQMMTDLFAAALLDADTRDRHTLAGTRIDVGVILTDRVLLGEQSGPAIIEGYGTIPGAVAREAIARALPRPRRLPENPAAPPPVTAPAAGAPQAAQIGVARTGREPGESVLAALEREELAVMRRLYTHPTTGDLVAAESRARAFPPAMARMIRTRRPTCAGPYCTAPVRHLDHLKPHAAGGATSLANGDGLCARCNLTKDLMATVQHIPADPESETPRAIAWTTTLGQKSRTPTTPLLGRHRRQRPPPTPGGQELRIAVPPRPLRAAPPHDDTIDPAVLRENSFDPALYGYDEYGWSSDEEYDDVA
ncbi:MAG: HNH endonuclease, partial [Brachybacterium sp.]|nr:HNH endonuclease [Brachybacterium sp.]